MIAELGVGLAAVFLDAFILRTVLVPSIMHIVGRTNWWLPRAVDRRVPHLSVEPTSDEEVEEAPRARRRRSATAPGPSAACRHPGDGRQCPA